MGNRALKISSLIDALADAGGSIEQIRAVVAAAEAENEAQIEREQIMAAEELERKRAAKRAGNAERQRRSRMSRRDSALQGVTARDSALQGCDQRRADAPADAPAIENKNLLDLQEKEPPKGGPKKKVQRKPETRIAIDTQPELADRLIAETSGMDMPTFRSEWALFRDWHIKNDQGARDWRAAWRTWTNRWVANGCKRVAASRAGSTVKPADNPDDPRVDFGGGVSAPVSTIRTMIERGSWPDDWGAKVGKPGCRVPERFWPLVAPKKLQAEARSSEMVH